MQNAKWAPSTANGPPSPEGEGIEAPTLGELPEGEGIEAPSLGGAVKIEDFDWGGLPQHT